MKLNATPHPDLEGVAIVADEKGQTYHVDTNAPHGEAIKRIVPGQWVTSRGGERVWREGHTRVQRPGRKWVRILQTAYRCLGKGEPT